MTARSLVLSLVAVSAITANRLLALDATGKVKLATANTDAIIGVADDVDTPAGSVTAVLVDGAIPVKLGGTVAAGDFITAGAGGVGVVGTGRVVGIALQAGVVGDVIDVLVQPGKVA